MDTVITITDILSQFGAFYQGNADRQKEVRQKLFYGFETAQCFTIEPTNDTVIRKSEAVVTEVIQPYQDAFTPKGSVVFKPFELLLKQLKIDQEFNPNQLVTSWLGFLTNNSVNRAEWPFIKWFVEMYLIPRSNNDMEKAVIFGGVYAAPTPGTAGTSAASMNGIKKVINDHITAARITTLATGAPSTTPETWVGQVEAFCKLVPENYWSEGMTLNMSRTLARRYAEGIRTKYKINYDMNGTGLDMVVDTNVKVKGLFSHNGSNKIWMTPKENAIMGVKGAANQNTFEIEHRQRKVSIYTDWFAGLDFVIPSLVFTNDQDLV
jgi:hypothetical protein